MKGNNGVKFFLVIAVIAILSYVAIAGNFFGIRIPGAFDIRQGIDINGGIDATLYSDKPNGKPTQKELDTAVTIINKRLDALRILDREVTSDVNNGRIVVRIPWKPGETQYNPDKAIEEIGKTALLTFQEVDPSQMQSDGTFKPTGKIVLQGTEVVDAKPERNPDGGMQVSLKLNAQGIKDFSDATARMIGKPIAIFMDNQFIEAPTVQAHITNGDCRITLGTATDNTAQQDAKTLADTIRSGSLPFRLEAKMVNSISPTLGKSALEVTLQAFLLAFILVCLFMILRYRLPGVLACIAVVGHTVLLLLAFSWLQLTMTLPGLAGIILSVGMGVDANVIIFERIKEELRNGKTLRAGIDTGFKRAFTAVLDANITTLIAAVMLLIYGTGSVKAFGYTLFIGVILSFLTAVTVSRIMIKSVSDLDIAKHHWLYGV